MPSTLDLLRRALARRAVAPAPGATDPNGAANPGPEAETRAIGAEKTVRQQRLSYFVLNILDHCNLRCRGCDHFSAIARERFVSLEDITKDLARMSELLGEDVARIGVMGGEPLLHPRLDQILTEARGRFPATTIQLVTNGILLMRQTVDFWDVCRQKQIDIVMTRYPIALDHDAITECAKAHGVAIANRDEDEAQEKRLYRIPLDVSGGQDPEASFSKCFHANNCALLMEGKLFTCTVAPNIRIFNERFGTHLPLLDEDSLDIHRAETKDEVLEFLCTPKPFCRHCNVSERSFGHPWERSRQDIREWTASPEPGG
jgi:hypothetical protein